MPLTPALPTPLTKYAKFLVRVLEEGAYLLLNDLVDNSVKADTVDDVEWRYVVARFTRPSITGAVEDYAQFGLNLVNITGGDIDTSWTSGDADTVDSRFDEWWTTVKPLYPTGYKFYDLRFYRRKFLPVITEDKTFQDSGPPQFIRVNDSPGTSASTNNAQQLSASVTLKTPVPRHWGRVYMPTPDVSRLDTNGRWTSGTRTTLANAWAELIDDLMGDEFFPVIPVRQVNKVFAPGLLGITEVQVDDVPDVVRRRRAKTTLARTIGVPTA